MTRAELIAALEQADGPSRELDAAIVAFNNNALCRPYPPSDDFGPKCRWQFWSLDEKHFLGSESRFKVPLLTSSIDAALMLVPDGFLWGVGTIKFGGDQGRRAYVANCGREGYIGPETPIISALGETPAIALCIASLRASHDKN